MCVKVKYILSERSALFVRVFILERNFASLFEFVCRLSYVLCMVGCVSNIQIVKEYERAVIFRLGRITDRKPKGPGLSFKVLHCGKTMRLDQKLLKGKHKSTTLENHTGLLHMTSF